MSGDQPASCVDEVLRQALVAQISGDFLGATRSYLFAFKKQPSMAPCMRDEFVSALRSVSPCTDRDGGESERFQLSSKSASARRRPREGYEEHDAAESRELNAVLPFWRLAASIFPDDTEVRAPWPMMCLCVARLAKWLVNATTCSSFWGTC